VRGGAGGERRRAAVGRRAGAGRAGGGAAPGGPAAPGGQKHASAAPGPVLPDYVHHSCCGDRGARRDVWNRPDRASHAQPAATAAGHLALTRGKRAYHEQGAYLGSCERPGVAAGPPPRRWMGLARGRAPGRGSERGSGRGPRSWPWMSLPAAVDGPRSWPWMSLPATKRRGWIDRRSGGYEPSTDLFASGGRRGRAGPGRAVP
jgi:hypothetical protein